MSIITFEILPDHIKLIKEINWMTISFPHINNCNVNPNSIFSFDNKLISDIGTILYGNRSISIKPDSEVTDNYSEIEIEWMKKIYNELPTAIDIICYFSEFKIGKFKTKFPLREWTCINE